MRTAHCVISFNYKIYAAELLSPYRTGGTSINGISYYKGTGGRDWKACRVGLCGSSFDFNNIELNTLVE